MDAFANVATVPMDAFSNMPKLDASAPAATRQKSCNACVRGKRRCDKRSPRCTRCAAKGLDCVYQKLPPSAAGGNASASTAGSTAESCGTSPELTDMPDFDMSFDMESLGTETSPESQHHHSHMPSLHHQHSDLQIDPELDFDIVDFMSAGAATGAATDVSSLFNFNAPVFAATPKMQVNPIPTAAPAIEPEATPIRDVGLLRPEDACIAVDPSDAHDPRTCAGFMVSEIGNLHQTFAKTRAAPFLHSRLWSNKLPKTMLSAFSAASAYATATPDNKAWIIKLVTNAAVQVHREGENVTSHADRLARVQALLLIDLIRIFDGDLSLRAAADRERHVFVEWIKDLRSILVELEAEATLLGGGSMSARDKPPKSWDSWIFLESVRRTRITCCAFFCLQAMLCQEEIETDIWEEATFTASKSLWEATSSVDFYRAWRDKPQYLVKNFNFKDFWQHGRIDDMDEFTRLMLTPQVGVEAMEHFVAGDVSMPIIGPI